ncbi:MAG: hypothetical protein V1925_04820 [Candidatus Omnitrophota bacterium]
MEKFKIQNSKFKIKPVVIARREAPKQSHLLSILLPLLLLSGCATVIEGAKVVAGLSTEELEANRKGAIKKTFNCNYDTCYNESKRILTQKGVYIYAQDQEKKMIAVYLSETDTTPAGVFFKIVDDTHTQIEVASPSTFGKEYIAEKLFLPLDNLTEQPGSFSNPTTAHPDERSEEGSLEKEEVQEDAE